MSFGFGFGHGITGGGAPYSVFDDAAIDLDFVNQRYLPSNLLSTTRASTGYAVNSAGVWTSFATNTPRITDKGLLVESARTNGLRNNAMSGASAGVVGSGGSLPTNWLVSAAGITTEVIGTGTENGLDYIDLKFSGTSGATGGSLFFEGATAPTASQSQVWANSAFLSLRDGDFTNVTHLQCGFWEYSSGPAFLAGTMGASVLGSVTSTLTRFWNALTVSNASTAAIRPTIRFTWSNASAIDFTLRIAMPQTELGAFPTSPIRTTGSAVTRAADDITLSSIPGLVQGTGTLFVEYEVSENTADHVWAYMSDGTSANTIHISHYVSGTQSHSYIVRSSAAQASIYGPSGLSAGDIAKGALAYGANDVRFAGNGTAGTPDVSATMPTGIDSFRVGGANTTDNVGNSYIRRVAYWPTARPTDDLTSITTV